MSELTIIHIESGQNLYLDKHLWLLIFSFLDDARTLIRLTWACTQFRNMLIYYDDAWKLALPQIQMEAMRILPRAILHLNKSTKAYNTVQEYGNAMSHLIVLYKKSAKQEQRVKIRRTTFIITCVILFYLCIVLLGLQLDNIINIPSWSLLIPSCIGCLYIMIVVASNIFYHSYFNYINSKRLLSGIFSCALSVFLLVIFVVVYLNTGLAQNLIWIFSATLVLSVVYLVAISIYLIDEREPLLFSACLSVSLFLLSGLLISYIYLHANGLSKVADNSVLPSMLTLYSVFLLYMSVVAFWCRGSPWSSQRVCLFGCMEFVASIILAVTSLLICLKLIGMPFLWGFVLLPLYLVPCNIGILCYQYVKNSRVEHGHFQTLLQVGYESLGWA